MRLIDRRDALLAGLAMVMAISRPTRVGAGESRPLALWGDSLTFGIGADTVAGKYPNLVGRLFVPVRRTFNGGVGGESSTQIAARMLADDTHREWIGVLWAGRNNYRSTATVLADIEAMVAHLSSRRCLVLSIINADLSEEYRGAPGYRAIEALNRALRARYAGRFLDVRASLIDGGLSSLGLTPTPEDLRGIEHDVPPGSLRADGVHLNDHGQAVVAREVSDAILRQGW